MMYTLNDVSSGHRKPELPLLCETDTESRTQLGKHTFSACGPNIWNSLPAAVRNINSHPMFRRALKSDLFHCAFIDYCNAQSASFV